MTFPNRLIFVVLAAAACLAGGRTQGDEEFVGPLSGWKNVKTDYGAVGDGVSDDTAAIQKGLDDLRLHEQSCVLYFPAGKYRLTGTVKTRRKAAPRVHGRYPSGRGPGHDRPPLGRQRGRHDAPVRRLVLEDQPPYARRGRQGGRGAGLRRRLLHLQRDLRDGLPGRRQRPVDGHRSRRPGRERGAPLHLPPLPPRIADQRLQFHGHLVLACRFEDCGQGLATTPATSTPTAACSSAPRRPTSAAPT